MHVKIDTLLENLGVWGSLMNAKTGTGGIIDTIKNAAGEMADSVGDIASSAVTAVLGKSSISKSDTDIGKIAGAIVLNIEGGYVPPSYISNLKGASAKMWSNSGETMFGLDRARGSDNTPEWNDFWITLDSIKKKNPSVWVHNYKGGPDQQVLANKAATIIAKRYDQFSRVFTPKSKELVNSDGRLKLMFVEAVYNGVKWFNQFAAKLNSDVASGILDTQRLIDNQISYRASLPNKLIANRQGQLKGMMA